MNRFVVISILALHAGLLGYAASQHSAVLDETGPLPTGMALLEFGRTDLYPNNPPLVKAVAALPVLAVDHNENWASVDDPPLSRPEFALGAELITANGANVFRLFTLARWACIPFSILGGWICFLWGKELYGTTAGSVTLCLWCFSPHVLGNAQLITPDVGAASFGLAACYTFWRWLRKPTWVRTLSAGVLLGIANLCKFTWVILFPLWFILLAIWLLSRGMQPNRGVQPRTRAEGKKIRAKDGLRALWSTVRYGLIKRQRTYATSGIQRHIHSESVPLVGPIKSVKSSDVARPT